MRICIYVIMGVVCKILKNIKKIEKTIDIFRKVVYNKIRRKAMRRNNARVAELVDAHV